MSRKDIEARAQAIKDIKNDLSEECKSFLMFRKELNSTMSSLVERHYILANKK